MKFCLGLLSILLLFINAQGLAQDSSFNQLGTVVVTASKFNERRIESPIAISTISTKSMKETNASRIDFLLNSVSGVYMPSIGNEQHMMAIRQPISLKGLYLYLEDGMPIRTSGLFSNNALIEINTNNIGHIEIIKGPASALYGAEAIGGVLNFISEATINMPLVQFRSQVNSLGLKQLDLSLSSSNSKGGWTMNTSWSDQQGGPIDYSNYYKKALSVRHDFSITKKISGFQSLQYINYNAQMTGSVDSVHFFQHNFSSLQTFTYRKINALRFRQKLNYQWNKNNASILNFMYRNNTMDQNPTYSIASTSNLTKFKGQINSNHFNSIVIDLQQAIQLPELQSKLVFGGVLDISHQHFNAHYIDIFKDTAIGKYTKYSFPIRDSLLSYYTSNILNKAVYINLITSISHAIKMNATVRYDQFDYLFNNKLTTGTPSSNNYFKQFTPKIGFTYNNNKWGGYINYGEGFVPPQITEMYNAVRVPYLLPQSFSNKEIGIWYQKKKWYTEISMYQMMGRNEIISVRQSDGVNLNQNAGSTNHIGIEYTIKYKADKKIEFNWNGTFAKHTYTSTNIKGVDVSGKEMSAAPNFWNNLSSIWKINNKLSALAEWQHQSDYFMDETNATKYPGFDVVNIRFNYQMNKSTFWLHLLNIGNAYYATMATKNFSVKGNAAYSYYIGEPRSIALGWKWTIEKRD